MKADAGLNAALDASIDRFTSGQSTARNGFHALEEPVRLPPMTEADLVLRFASAQYGSLLRDHARQQWFKFGPHAWHVDTDGQALRSLQEWITNELDRAVHIVDSKDRETQIKFLARCLRASALKQLLELAGSQELLTADGTNWDARPWLVATTNGVIDLANVSFRPGVPDDHISRTLAVPYDPDARCPRFERFLTEVLPDADTIDFLWRAMGYTLSGLTREHVMFLLNGPTRAGKTTLLEVMHAIWGSYGKPIAFASLTRGADRDGSQATPDLAVLPGVRLVTATEVNRGLRFDEARIKGVTGGDQLVARPLYGRPIEFRPQFRLWLGVNDLPRASEDPAFWARCRVIRFPTSFLGREDRDLQEQLVNETPGILAWCVRGFARYLDAGLQPSQDMLTEAHRWRDDNDALAPFLASLGTVSERMVVADMFAKYDTWANAEHLSKSERLGRIGFGRAIARKFTTSRSNGRTYAQVEITTEQECR